MKAKGFTLIELVLVILVISILAFSALPKLFTNSEFETISQRDQVIGLLRSVQQRAMQDTQTINKCHRILFASGTIGLSDQAVDGTCDSGVAAVSAVDDFFVIDGIDSYTAVNGTPTANAISFIDFGDLGQPTPSLGSCASNGCKITIDTHSVCIESEGYIHACP